MGQMCSCQFQEMTYEFFVRPLQISNVASDATNVQVEVEMFGRMEKTCGGQLEGDKFVWDNSLDGMWTFAGRDVTKDAFTVHVSGLATHAPPLNVSTALLPKNVVRRVNLPVGDHVLTLEVLVRESVELLGQEGSLECATVPSPLLLDLQSAGGAPEGRTFPSRLSTGRRPKRQKGRPMHPRMSPLWV
eukprot:EG_transcript_12749